MQALLTVIMTWLSINFGLPATHDHPSVELASPAQMATVRYSRLAAVQPDRVAAASRLLAARVLPSSARVTVL